MRLVLLEQVVPERSARRVEHDRDALGRFFLQEFVQHVEHAEHRAGGYALRVGERRQRMKCTVQIGRAVDQQQLARSHGLERGREILDRLLGLRRGIARVWRRRLAR